MWDEAFLSYPGLTNINIVSEWESTLQLIGVFGLSLVCAFPFSKYFSIKLFLLEVSLCLVYTSTYVGSHTVDSSYACWEILIFCHIL